MSFDDVLMKGRIFLDMENIPASTSHYGKTADCRASKCLPCAFHRRTANVVFAVRFPDDARQTKTHGIHTICRAFVGGARQSQIFDVVFLGTHGNSSPLTGVNLCRAP
jgi:hypothetical protein